jgi:DNA-binding SARP family transcriptional activator
MDFRLLGTFEVWRNGEPLPLGGRRQRAVLALLAMNPGTVVSTDRMVEEIWADAAPPSALRTLHSYVSRLRTILRDGGRDPLVRREPGYVLDVDPSDVDAVRFERLVREGAAALDAGDAGTADRALRAGLALWRGEALADFAYEPFATAEGRRLDERRLEALELRIDADLTLGRHARVVAELEGLVARNPYRERIWAQLMVALYRGGRQADALAAYGRVRGILVEEQGIEPGDGLRQLERQVLDQSADLTLPAVPRGARRSAPAGPPGTPPVRHVPLPERLRIRPDIGVIGRTAQIGSMTSAVGRADGGLGRAVLLVSGEAGQGKSTVAAEVARRAFDDGACVLSGHCEQDVSAPYQLFTESLGHFVRHAPEDELRDLMDDGGPELGALVPELGRRLPDLPSGRAVDPDAERFQLFGAVVGLLAALSRDRTVVLVFDDLQWADHGSLQLLRHLAADDRPMRLAVVATFRDGEAATSDQLVETLGALRRLDGVGRIDLPGFEPTEVVSVMTAIAGRPMDDQGAALARAVHEETDGNPFFVSEVTRHLLEAGALRDDGAGGWIVPTDVGETSLPAGVREVIDARVVRLGRASAADLALAAVIGRDFDLDVLLAASETTPDDLLDTLEGAATVSLVREPLDRPGWYSFSHALIQRTLYEGIGAARRALLHRRVFEVLARQDAGSGTDRGPVPAAEVARHLVASARPDDSADVVRYACRAAEEAVAALDPEEAVRWYGVALGALGEDAGATRTRVLAHLGDAQRQTGDLACRATELARTFGYPDEASRAADPVAI